MASHLCKDEISLNLLLTPQVNLLILFYFIVTNWTSNPMSMIMQMHGINRKKPGNEWQYEVKVFFCRCDKYIYYIRTRIHLIVCLYFLFSFVHFLLSISFLSDRIIKIWKTDSN